MRSYVHIYALLLIVSHARFGAALEEVTVGPVEEHGDDVINTVCKTRQYMTENYGIERVVERERTWRRRLRRGMRSHADGWGGRVHLSTPSV